MSQTVPSIMVQSWPWGCYITDKKKLYHLQTQEEDSMLLSEAVFQLRFFFKTHSNFVPLHFPPMRNLHVQN